LTWVDDDNGDLLYSWANSARANNASEWAEPLVLPSPSQWNSSPDMFIDAAGRIGVVYAVPVNEARGIYLVVSEDKGITWSAPLPVLDAASFDWQMVNHPKVTLSDDGSLHLLFTRYATLREEPIELYSMQSSNSGATWSEPQTVGDGAILWSDIVSYDGSFIHRLWQEEKNSEIASLAQVSQDGGTTWGRPINIASASGSSSAVGLIFDGVKELHFIRLEVDDSLEKVGKTNLIVHDSRWDGNQWTQEIFQEFALSGLDVQFSIAGGLSSNGFINVCIVVKHYDSDGKLASEILSIARSLGRSNENLTPFPAEISGPETPAAPIASPTTAFNPAQSTPFSSLAAEPSPVVRNVLGLVGFLAVAAVMIFIFVKRASRKK
jgi:hypothetical protein